MVFVRAHTKRDGTQVREHSRWAPTLVAAGGGTGPLVVIAIMDGFATHNSMMHTPGAQTVRPASLTAPVVPHAHQARG